MQTKTMETTVLAPLPSNHADATTPVRQPVRRTSEVRRHRAPGVAKRAAQFVAQALRARGKDRAAAPAPDTAAPSPATPAREALNPIAPKLYYRAQSERLQPREAIALTPHQPLLTREQVKQQLGFDAPGELKAAIHLPGAKEPIYCFDRSFVDEQGNAHTSFTFATPRQLGQIRTMLEIGALTWDEIYDGMLTVQRTPYTSDEGNRSIGRTRWLPGRPAKGHFEAAEAPAEYAQVADRQLAVRIDDYHTLWVQDVSAPLNEDMEPVTVPGQRTATIDYNPELVPAGDSWSPAPHVPDHLVSNLRYTGAADS